MTMWGVYFRKRQPLPLAPLRWSTPDGDSITVLRLPASPGAPRVIMLHGLEGSARSHYANGILSEAHRRGWGADFLLFRTCDGRLNDSPRSYHSGETADLDLVVSRVVAEFPESPIGLVGVSLGGNVLLKWLGERCESLPSTLRGAVAVSVPFDLARSSRHMGQGASRMYQRHFLRLLRRKALAKLERFPGIASTSAVSAADTLWGFDDAFTSVVHGFADAADYYAQSSSLAYLPRIRLPTLLLSARDDPFMPSELLPQVEEVARGNSMLSTVFPERGGHAGFVEGRWPGVARFYADRRIASYLEEHFRGIPPGGSYGAPTAGELPSG